MQMALVILGGFVVASSPPVARLIAAIAALPRTPRAAVGFVAFDTAAGVVTGILAQAAQASPDPESWRAALDAVWWHPIVGQLRQGQTPSLAVVGSAALSIGTVAAALSLRRAGRPAVPLVLLALSGFGLQVFNTHAWPGGPLTFGGNSAMIGSPLEGRLAPADGQALTLEEGELARRRTRI
jgi:hypothetical protein